MVISVLHAYIVFDHIPERNCILLGDQIGKDSFKIGRQIEFFAVFVSSHITDNVGAKTLCTAKVGIQIRLDKRIKNDGALCILDRFKNLLQGRFSCHLGMMSGVFDIPSENPYLL